MYNRLVLGGEFHAADIGSESSPSGKTNELRTSFFMATAGYVALAAWKVNVIPYVGIGPGSATLTLKSRGGGASLPTTQDPTFDEVIAAPGALSKMTGSYVIVQPGLAVDVFLPRDKTSSLALTLGIRFSSPLSPNRTKWKYEGREVFGGPDLGPVGGNVRVVMGIGGFRLAGR
ncbi:MAG: hypothetical protein FJ202_09995 [Gemmatimonadetes bacterium]|nr:hypothetical protein [Gemmatimonadota bacterium]